MKKVLCIDDTPDEILASGMSLRNVITSVFSDTPYKILFKETGKEGIKEAGENIDVKLVLLDIEFNKKVEGPEIADKLRQEAPHVKIIVLTRVDDKGKKISFGWKPNVVHYVLKKELTSKQILQRLINLSKSIIEDFENKRWEIEYPATGTLNLTNNETGKTYGIDIPSSMDNFIKIAVAAPNRPILNPGGSLQQTTSEASLNKVLNTINAKVLEGTEWNTWGILSRENCAKGQLKLIIGPSCPRPISNDAFVPQSEFEEFKKETSSRLSLIEQAVKTPK